MKRSLLLLVLLIAGQQPLAAQRLTSLPPARAPVQFYPPTEYRMIWRAVESCSGLQGDFDRVRWYVVPGTAPFAIDAAGRMAVGYWEPHRIYISAPELHYGRTIAHEILHELLQAGDESAPAWQRCNLTT